MTPSDGNGANAKKCDWTHLGKDAGAPTSPPSTPANGEDANDRQLPPRARRIRSRQGKRTQRHQGEPVTIELRDGSQFPATVVDNSPSGLAIEVADSSPFRRRQHVAVRQRGVLKRAIIRNVDSEAEVFRVGLTLLPA